MEASAESGRSSSPLSPVRVGAGHASQIKRRGAVSAARATGINNRIVGLKEDHARQVRYALLCRKISEVEARRCSVGDAAIFDAASEEWLGRAQSLLFRVSDGRLCFPGRDELTDRLLEEGEEFLKRFGRYASQMSTVVRRRAKETSAKPASLASTPTRTAVAPPPRPVGQGVREETPAPNGNLDVSIESRRPEGNSAEILATTGNANAGLDGNNPAFSRTGCWRSRRLLRPEAWHRVNMRLLQKHDRRPSGSSRTPDGSVPVQIPSGRSNATAADCRDIVFIFPLILEDRTAASFGMNDCKLERTPGSSSDRGGCFHADGLMKQTPGGSLASTKTSRPITPL